VTEVLEAVSFGLFQEEKSALPVRGTVWLESPELIQAGSLDSCRAVLMVDPKTAAWIQQA
jgi:hypothetical protein